MINIFCILVVQHKNKFIIGNVAVQTSHFPCKNLKLFPPNYFLYYIHSLIILFFILALVIIKKINQIIYLPINQSIFLHFFSLSLVNFIMMIYKKNVNRKLQINSRSIKQQIQQLKQLKQKQKIFNQFQNQRISLNPQNINEQTIRKSDKKPNQQRKKKKIIYSELTTLENNNNKQITKSKVSSQREISERIQIQQNMPKMNHKKILIQKKQYKNNGKQNQIQQNKIHVNTLTLNDIDFVKKDDFEIVKKNNHLQQENNFKLSIERLQLGNHYKSIEINKNNNSDMNKKQEKYQKSNEYIDKQSHKNIRQNKKYDKLRECIRNTLNKDNWNSFSQSIENAKLQKQKELEAKQLRQGQKNKLHNKKTISLQQRSRKVTVLSYQTLENSDEGDDSYHKIKTVNVLSIQPKKQNNVPRLRKSTAMNKYDFQFQNIRLAQALLKIKPTKVCDTSQQKKFYKKQLYFKDLRSCSLDLQQHISHEIIKKNSNHQSNINLSLASDSIYLPKINQRYRTENE